MNYLLARIAGARVDVLKHVPGSVAKQTAMGAVLLTTAGFAAMSAAYALSITGVASGFVCVLAGLVWGVAILNLDRLLVIGLAKEKGWRAIAMALPRVALAFVIGAVISTPLMLKVFDTEISAQLNKNILVAQEELRSSINESTANEDLATAETRMYELRSMINTGPTADPSANPRVKAIAADVEKLEARADTEKAKADELRAGAVAEEEGTAGTGVAGCAAMCVEKKRLASDAEQRFEATRGEIAAKQQESVDYVHSIEGSLLEESKKAIADAEVELPIVERKVDQLRDQIRSAQDSSWELEQANTGIISRLKALGDLTAGNATAANAHLMVMLLFMCLEILPVLFKVMSNFGTPTSYDIAVEQFDTEEAREATEEVEKRRQVDDLRRQAELDAEKSRIEQQHATILKINDTVVEHQAELVEEALVEWSAHAKRVSAERMREWSRSLRDEATAPAGVRLAKPGDRAHATGTSAPTGAVGPVWLSGADDGRVTAPVDRTTFN
ncbi:DUF4407 domain-containing protein [Prescottella subtropica]|uniref:DUF4407 domain-containing protein n=1 Tax=Prescottella subtropica TaxID=2545757 RepID=UPI00138711AE|nr:DUF4407 domain-containing protein [Prescottella subtropica]